MTPTPWIKIDSHIPTHHPSEIIINLILYIFATCPVLGPTNSPTTSSLTTHPPHLNINTLQSSLSSLHLNPNPNQP